MVKILSSRSIDLHQRRLGSPRKRKGPISGTKGMDRLCSEEAFYANPLPDCLCRTEPPHVSDTLGQCVYGGAHFSKQPQVSHLMESIEKDYVLVNPHFTSLEVFSDYFEVFVQDDSTSNISLCFSKRTNTKIRVAKKTKDPSSCYSDGLENSKSNELEALAASSAFANLSKVHGIFSLSPSNRLELLHLYVQILEGAFT